MNSQRIRRLLGVPLVTSLLCLPAAADPGQPQRGGHDKPKLVRDLLWVWGNPEMARPGQQTLATFAQASPAQRARLLGVPNIVMAGTGIPNDDQLAERLTGQVAEFPRLVWEIQADGEGGPPFVYQQRMVQVARLVDQFANIEGVLLDDMSTLGIDQGFKPEHIRQIRRLVPSEGHRVRIWGVVYTMSLDRQGIDQYINELDVINLWTWHARDIVQLEANVRRCQRQFADKPIVLGLYLYDYGADRPMPRELLAAQCDVALQLAHAERVGGIVFLTINNDPEVLQWTADWIGRVGDQRLGARPGQGGLPAGSPAAH